MHSDLRFAIRQLFKDPGFAAINVLTLALGIGANLVIFSIFSALYLRPFPFEESTRLLDLNETAPRWNLEYTGLAYPDFCGWREHNRSFEGMAVWNHAGYNLSFQGDAQRIRGVRVSHDLASVLRISPALGRFFRADEDQPGGDKVAVLANGFWQRQFGGDRAVIGQTLRLDHEPYTIVGVLPPGEKVLVEGDLWVPLALDPNVRAGWFLNGVGRLRPGVTPAAARADLARVHAGLVEHGGADANTFPKLTPLRERYFGSPRLMIQMLLGAVLIVLLIACGNVAALMLARGLARSRELGVRLALGASAWRVGRLIAVESLMLAGMGGVAGMILGQAGLRLLVSNLTDRPPTWVRFDPDWRVWLFAGLMVIVSALLGAWPVIRSLRRQNLRNALQSATAQSTMATGGRRSLNALVVGEVALSLVLMVQAGLLLQAFRSVRQVEPGYRPENLLVYEVALPEARYGNNQARLAFFREHLERVRELPSVTDVSAVTAPPLGGHWGNFFVIEGVPPVGPDESDPVVLQRLAFPGYFETMGIGLVAGRTLTPQDGLDEGSRVVVVNETFARRYWPNSDPIGQRIRHRGDHTPWMTVVGVVRDVKHYGLDQPMIPGVYLAYPQDPQSQMAIVLRSAVPPSELVTSVRSLLRESDPDLALANVMPMAERLSQSMWARRLVAWLFAIFSGVALALAVGGIYGVFSFTVNRRRQELGVRLALGAQRPDLLWLVVRQGLRLTVIGSGIGLVVVLATAPLTRH
ncbi:MAG: ABC transporter permease, partial [Verrucomicrobia bacterium]|nr:ABC transporter permease [Verrucomicrobiota bacterium]